MSASRRWSALQKSPLSSEYDRKDYPITPAVRLIRRASTLSAAIYKPGRLDFSFGADVLRSMSTDSSWTSLSPEGWNFSMAWLELFGNWAEMEQCWGALLVAPNVQLIKDSEPPIAWAVLRSTRWGVIGWRASLSIHRGNGRDRTHFQLNIAGGTLWEFSVTTNPAGWFAANFGAKAPCRRSVLPVDARCPGIICFVNGEPRGLWEFSARAAVKGLNVSFFKGLADTGLGFKPASTRPKTEGPLVETLLDHWLPGPTAAERTLILDTRLGAKPEPTATSILQTQECEEGCAGLTDDQEVDVFEAVEVKIQTHRHHLPGPRPQLRRLRLPLLLLPPPSLMHHRLV